MAMTEEETVAFVEGTFRRRRWVRRRRQLRPALYAALAAVLIVTGAWLVWFSSVLDARTVRVTGNSALTAARIEQAAQAPLDQPLARVDLAAIQARVEAIPAVKSATVSRSWPHTIEIAVVERTPLAVVERGVGLQAVDEDGVLFGRYLSVPAGLPEIETSPNVRAEALAEAAKVVRSLRADIAAKVARVEVQSVDRIQLVMKDGRTVLWGSADSSEQKAEVLAILLRQPAGHIDVSVPGRPTTR